MTDEIASLERLQEILYRLITAPSGVAEGLAHETALPASVLAAIIAGDPRMTPAERVEIYANGYIYRLLDVLKEDFRATFAVTGADQFHNLVTGYLIDFPPTEPSIYFAGQNFAAYLSTHPMRERWPFLADLAQFERATLESFHATDARPLDADAMRQMAAIEWPGLAMRAHPATRLVESEWRVDELLRAVEEGIEWHLPNREAATIVVWRQDALVYYRAAEVGEREALRMAVGTEGTTFAAICEAIAMGASEGEDVTALINRLLERWLLDGLLLGASR